ncbi:glycoside hydrolase [Thozetella sp. PMI_491]|nr:glycoside hydrolase [Thozetella sp. PMI_491]
MVFLAPLAALVGVVLPFAAAQVALPLHSSSRWILDNNGARIKFKCVNWAGHGEANIPEGLNKQSVEFIAAAIKQQGFNCVRLTYSIDHALDPTLKVQDSFIAAAAASNNPVTALTDMYSQVVEKNPFTANATNRDVFGRVVDALWEQGIMTLLDNHVSKASWCCNLEDGNGWWDTAFGYNDENSRYFHTQDWLNGLQAMATWAKDHKGIVAMSLRNELREFLLQDTNGRQDWYNLVKQAGTLVHQTHPDVLVVVGGVLSATDLSHVRSNPLDTSGWPGKHVWEWHAYSFTVTFLSTIFSNCWFKKQLYGAFDGFLLEQNQAFTGPLILSEFGVGMTGGPHDGLNDDDDTYLSCLVEYMTGNDADWSLWAVQGSYYIREGTLDYDEGWGLFTHDWSQLRNPNFPARLGDMWKTTQGPDCFVQYVSYKCAKQMGILVKEVRPPDRSGFRRFLVGLSFGVSSSVLVDLLHDTVARGRARGMRSSFEVHVVHVDSDPSLGDDDGVGSPRTAETLGRYREKYPYFTFYSAPLASALRLRTVDWSALPSLDKEKPASGQMQALFESLPSNTSKADILRLLTRNILLSRALSQSCHALLLGHSTTSLAELTLAETAKGRGFSLPWQVHDGPVPVLNYPESEGSASDGTRRGETAGNIPMYSPLRDLLRKELVTYSGLTSPPLTEVIPKDAERTGAVVSHKELSIEEVMSRYFAEVEQNYPSVVANVAKTTGKLDRIEAEERCGLCNMLLDEQGDERWRGEIGDDDGVAGSVWNLPLCYGCKRSIGG